MFGASRFSSTYIGKTLRLALALLRHCGLFLPLLLSPRSSVLRRYLVDRPEVIEVVYGRFISANWNAATKVRVALNHAETVAAIGGLLSFPADRVEKLIDLPLADTAFLLSLDQPRWLFREGQLAFSLWEGPDRIFSLSFSLCDNGQERIAFLGGIQGRRQVDGEEEILERYRRFTKQAFGCRPRDFIIEAFKIFCRAIGVTQIRAVADQNHPLKGKNEGFTLAYDEVWQERGGFDRHDGFFELPTNAAQRSEQEIPPKKRSLYKKRAAMFEEIERRLIACVATEQPKEALPATIEAHAAEETAGFDTLLLAVAYGLALAALGTTNLLGGTWIGFTIGIAFVQTTYWLLKGNIPDAAARRIAAIYSLRRNPVLARVLLASVITAAIVWFDFQLDPTRPLGRTFKIYLIPIFLSSLLCGTRVTAMVIAACLLIVNFLHLPPRYSLSIANVDELLEMLTFGMMAIIVLIVPRLLIASIELTDARRARKQVSARRKV